MKYNTLYRFVIGIIVLLFLFSSCAPTISKQALQLSKESLQNRQLQTRRFDTDEKTLLSASAAVLQDLGFKIHGSETELGLIVCHKLIDAKSKAGKAGDAILCLLTGAPYFRKLQLIKASLVTRPTHFNETDKSKCQCSVRITFQRVEIVIGQKIPRLECINEGKVYQGFFDKLAQSLFLEAHEI